MRNLKVYVSAPSSIRRIAEMWIKSIDKFELPVGTTVEVTHDWVTNYDDVPESEAAQQDERGAREADVIVVLVPDSGISAGVAYELGVSSRATLIVLADTENGLQQGSCFFLRHRMREESAVAFMMDGLRATPARVEDLVRCLGSLVKFQSGPKWIDYE